MKQGMLRNLANCQNDFFHSIPYLNTSPILKITASGLKSLKRSLESFDTASLYFHPIVRPLLRDLLHKKDISFERYDIFEQNFVKLDRSVKALKELANDIYCGFLSKEDRRYVQKPDKKKLPYPPLVVFTKGQAGIFTKPFFPSNSGNHLSCLQLPEANKNSGLLAWSSLPHEVIGHDICSADTSLCDELIGKIRAALNQFPRYLSRYWTKCNRITECTSHCLGILNMGPVAAVGVITCMREMRRALGKQGDKRPVLGFSTLDKSPYPNGLMSGYLVASAVGMLNFKGAAAWSAQIRQETNNDFKKEISQQKNLGIEDNDLWNSVGNDYRLIKYLMESSAATVAETIIKAPLRCLGNHAFCEIQNWRNADQHIVDTMSTHLAVRIVSPKGFLNDITPRLKYGCYATHVVASAISAALSGSKATCSIAFENMVKILNIMYDHNRVWKESCRTPEEFFGYNIWE